MSDSVNQATVKTFPEGGPFSSNTIAILTASETAFNAVAPIVAAAFGVDSTVVNVLPIPGGYAALNLQLGLDLHDDLFSFLFRQAIAADQATFDAWKASKPFRAFRVYYETDPTENTLYGKPTFRPRLDTPSEIPLQPNYTAMIDSTIQRLTGRYNINVINWVVNLLGYQLAPYGGVCYLEGVSCAGDTRDSGYLDSNVTFFFTDPTGTDQYMVFGANHEYLGLAVYSNVVIYNYHAAVGMDPVLNSQFLNSANQPVPNFSSPSSPLSPASNLPQFLRWKYARACQPLDTTCSAVPSTGFPSLPPNSLGLVATRSYEASAEYDGPAVSVLLKPVVLHLVDRCRPQTCDSDGSCGRMPGYVEYNIAFGSQSVSQSSTFFNFVATNAVDGQTSLFSGALTDVQLEPYWEIDLGFERFVTTVDIDGLLIDFYILVSNTPFTSTKLEDAIKEADNSVHVLFDWGEGIEINQSFRYLRVQHSGIYALFLSEVQINSYCMKP